MKTLPGAFKWLLSAALLAVVLPFLWNCIDYNPDQTRFWLLDPDISRQRSLLPFTYCFDRYYGYTGLTMDDTTYQVENVQSWKAFLQNKATDKDIHQILYLCPPDAYFDKKYPRGNTFIKALQATDKAPMLAYLNFAKSCEEIFAFGDWESFDKPKDPNRANILLNQGLPLLEKFKQTPELGRRMAFQLMRLRRATKNPEAARNLYKEWFENSTTRDWLYAAATHQYAETFEDAVQHNIQIARAWDAGFYNRIWLRQSLADASLEKSIQQAPQPRDKAILVLIPALRQVGPALEPLQKAYTFDATLPDLSKLMAREVNKLENWLITPGLYDFNIRPEAPMADVDTAAQLKTDLAHLKACRQFVQQVITDNKRSDAAFWRLTAAHLAYLDQDFAQTAEQARQGLQTTNAPASQQVQLRIMELLAEIGASGQISSATEDKIPGLFRQLSQYKAEFADPDGLRQHLAALLSDQFMRRKEVAKAALLLGQTTEYYEGYGFLGARPLYDALLEHGDGAAFDEALRIVEQPKTDFERWFAGTPHAYSTEIVWDDATQNIKPAPGASTAWDVHRLREFKAMYYTRRDQIDSAFLAIQKIPDTYWKRKGSVSDYDHVYFESNPFSVGIPVQGVPLTEQDSSGRFNKRNFLEKIIELRGVSDPAKQQEAWLLLGNAYFNMSYYGYEWWLMMAPEKSSGEMYFPPASEDNSTGSVPMPDAWRLATLTGLLLGAWQFRRRKRMLLLLLPLLLPFSCQKSGVTKAQKPITPFEDVYYRCTLAQAWFEKAAQINPNNDLGIAATYMAGACAEIQQRYAFERSRKTWDDNFKPGPNKFYDSLKGKNFSTPLSCQNLKEKL